MPRPLRVWFPGAIYHVIARGNNRQPIFLHPRDYLRYLHLIEEARLRYDSEVWAYVLMENHVHLMLRTGQHHPISKLMQWLQMSYTIYFNRQYERVGHLFQGRFKSQLVEEDAYCLELSRYIHLNPVRARAVTAPEQYRWSSYRAYVEEETVRNRQVIAVNAEVVLSMVSPVAVDRSRLYRTFVRLGVRPQAEDFVLRV